MPKASGKDHHSSIWLIISFDVQKSFVYNQCMEKIIGGTVKSLPHVWNDIEAAASPLH